MYKLFFLLFLLTTLNSFSQTNKDYREQKRFLRFVRKNIYGSRDTLILRKIFSNDLVFCGKLPLNILELSENEVSYVYSKIKSDTNILIKEEYLSKTKLISTFDNELISEPIFLRNYTYCIFGFGTYNVREIMIYTRNHHKWMFYKKIAQCQTVF